MPHFLIDKNLIKDGFLYLKDKETISHMISSLRIKTGEAVKFIDGEENSYEAVVSSANKNELVCKIVSCIKSKRKLPIKLCALVCVLKPDGMNLAIQNAVQVGTCEIYTVFSDNCAVSKNSVLNKADKWQKIGMEAFKQCERADIPKVFDISTFESIFSKFKKNNILIFAEKYDKLTLREGIKTVDKNEKILAVFGCEGGFSEKEFEYFITNEYKMVTLGNLIYKAPNAVTAGLFGITQYA